MQFAFIDVGLEGLPALGKRARYGASVTSMMRGYTNNLWIMLNDRTHDGLVSLAIDEMSSKRRTNCITIMGG